MVVRAPALLRQVKVLAPVGILKCLQLQLFFSDLLRARDCEEEINSAGKAVELDVSQVSDLHA